MFSRILPFCVSKLPPPLSSSAIFSAAENSHPTFCRVPGRNKNVFTMQKCVSALNGERNAFWLLSFNLRMGRIHLKAPTLSLFSALPHIWIHSADELFMVDVSALKSVCFKLFRPIDWSLHGFNQKYRLSTHIKRTFPACEQAREIGKCCTDVMQIFHGSVKGFVEKTLCMTGSWVRVAYLTWVRHGKRKSQSCYLWSEVFEGFTVGSFNISCIVDWTNNPSLCSNRNHPLGSFS